MNDCWARLRGLTSAVARHGSARCLEKLHSILGRRVRSRRRDSDMRGSGAGSGDTTTHELSALEGAHASLDLRAVVDNARDIASKTGSRITSIHLLLAIFTVPNPASRVLRSEGVHEGTLLDVVESADTNENSDVLEAVQLRATRIAAFSEVEAINSLHLLMAISTVPCRASSLLLRTGVDVHRIHERAARSVSHQSDRQGCDRVRPRLTSFVGSVEIDSLHLARNLARIKRRVLSKFETVWGAELDLILVMKVRAPLGIQEEVVAAVSEEVGVLGFKYARFGGHLSGNGRRRT